MMDSDIEKQSATIEERLRRVSRNLGMPSTTTIDSAVIREAAATIADLREQSGRWEAASHEEYERAEKEYARATAVERALVERDAAIAVMLPAIDDLSYCLFCNEDLWTEEAAKIGLADKVGRHASDCPYLDLPTSARLAADVLSAAVELHEARADLYEIEAGDYDELILTARSRIVEAEIAFYAAVAAWRAGRT